jgi:hypothetical protein
MRRTLLASAVLIPAAAVAVLTSASPAFADNAPGTGQPGQSCQSLEPNTPGHAANSPGSPFNEPSINSQNGGVGGQHYSANSQYDVACFQAAQHH